MALAVLFPGIWIMYHRNAVAGLILFFLQPTIIFWIVGAVWAVRSLQHRRRQPRRISIITPEQWAMAAY